VNETRVDVFRRFFDAIVEQCQQDKLVWGRELYLDGTQVNANADLDSLTPRFAVEAREAMQAHLVKQSILLPGQNCPLHSDRKSMLDEPSYPALSIIFVFYHLLP
jgi:hypothetical protein